MCEMEFPDFSTYETYSRHNSQYKRMCFFLNGEQEDVKNDEGSTDIQITDHMKVTSAHSVQSKYKCCNEVLI